MQSIRKLVDLDEEEGETGRRGEEEGEGGAAIARWWPEKKGCNSKGRNGGKNFPKQPVGGGFQVPARAPFHLT